MRLKLDSPQLKDIRFLLETDFDSPLPSEDTLSRAWNDPLVQALFKSKEGLPEIGALLQQTAIRAFANVQGRVGMATGIPADIIGDFAQSISTIALEQGERDWGKFALEGGQAIIDAVMQAYGAVPIIGWIAQLSYSLINSIIELATKPTPKPLLLSYSRNADEDLARQALKVIENSNSDWTRLFLPAWTGEWTSKEAENGFTVHPKEASDGFGCVPPSAFGLISIQVRGKPAEGVEAALGALGGNKPVISGAKWGQKEKKKLAPYVENTWGQYPSVARICNAVWSAISTNRTAAVFNLRPLKIRDAWSDFVEGAVWYRDYQKKRPRETLGVAALMQVSMSPIEVNIPPSSPWATKGSPSRLRIDALAEAWCLFLATRQHAMCDTTAVAYASEGQAAFKDPVLHEKLINGRKLLITTLDADKIDLDDVVDADFRDALESYKGPRSGHMPNNTPKMPDLLKPKLVGSVGGGGGGIALAALAAMAVGAAYKLTRKGR